MQEEKHSNRALGLYWGSVATVLILAAPVIPRACAWLPPCLFRTLTGFPCPTCGATRAAIALARFHPVSAWVANPLVTLGYVAFLAGGLIAGIAALAGRPLAEPRRFSLAVRAAACSAAALNWIWVLVHFRAG
jgi:hypothetical protein